MTNETNRNGRAEKIRKIVTIGLLLLGTILVAMSLAAEFLGVDITPGFGIVQIFQLLLGITCLTLGIFVAISKKRRSAPKSLQAEIGARLAATGLVFAYITGLSDLFSIGTHVQPRFERPFVGPLQLGGIVLSVLVVIAGILLYYTSRGSDDRDKSSMDFMIDGDSAESETAS